MSASEAVITLTSDFGWSDPYVAQMKGVLATLSPRARVVDLSHELVRFDVPCAARFIARAAPYFPDGTIHVVVVDPGVGSDRRRVIVEGTLTAAMDGLPRRMRFVGPDNGTFSLLDLADLRAFVITADGLPRFPDAPTFDGRNVFCPAAALLALGRRAEDIGTEVPGSELVQVALARPIVEGSIIRGEVVAIDSYGNAETNISADDLTGRRSLIAIPRLSLELELSSCFAHLSDGRLGAIINSAGFVELAVREQSAHQLFGLALGEPVTVTIQDQ